MNPLKQLETVGQAPWLDYLKRSLIEKGELNHPTLQATAAKIRELDAEEQEPTPAAAATPSD